MVRKKDQGQKLALKHGDGNKHRHVNTKAPQTTPSHIQVRSTLHPMGTLNSSTENLGDPDAYPSKRLKPTTTDGPDHTMSQKAVPILSDDTTASVGKESSQSKDGRALPPELRHLQSNFDFTEISIISSSKIEKSVQKLLLTLERFSFADLNSKPGVAILSAKVGASAKMISIVEIAKGAIQKDHGKWYQYSKLHGELAPLQKTSTKREGGGRTLSEWQTEQKRPREESPVRSMVQEVEETKLGGNEDDDEDAFETMGFTGLGERNVSTQEHEALSKVRAVPVMTIYMSRVPVPGLKEMFGQTLDLQDLREDFMITYG